MIKLNLDYEIIVSLVRDIDRIIKYFTYNGYSFCIFLLKN